MTRDEIKELYANLEKTYDTPKAISRNKKHFIDTACKCLFPLDITVDELLEKCYQEVIWFPYPKTILEIAKKRHINWG